MMASKNMCHAVKSHLEQQQWPLYLQPQHANGMFPWLDNNCLQSAQGDGDEERGDGSNEDVGQAGPSTSDETARSHKRHISASDPESDLAQLSPLHCKITSD